MIQLSARPNNAINSHSKSNRGNYSISMNKTNST